MSISKENKGFKLVLTIKNKDRMTLLYILAFVLLCVALGYLFRVIDLSRELKTEKEWAPTENDNRMSGRFFLIFMFAFIAWSFYQVYQYGDRTLPKSASEHGDKVDELMKYNMYIIWLVFVLTNFVLFISLGNTTEEKTLKRFSLRMIMMISL
jgi:Ca2+/Na+ antiporter